MCCCASHVQNDYKKTRQPPIFNRKPKWPRQDMSMHGIQYTVLFQPGISKALHAVLCSMFIRRWWLYYPAGLGIYQHWQRSKSWFRDCALDYLANSSHLIWIENLWVVVQKEDKKSQTQQCRWPEGSYQSYLGFHYTCTVPPTDCLHTTVHWCSNSCE